MRKNRVFFLTAAFCLWAAAFFSYAAHAQKKESYSDLERAGFAFHKMSGFKPDFKTWILQSEQYNKATPVKKVELLQSDLYRLQNGYYNYMPDTDLITLTLPLLMEIPTMEDVEGTGSYARVHINFKDLPENYLPMKIGDLWVAVVIEDFGRIAGISLGADQYAEIARRIRHNKARKSEKPVQTTVEIQLRPLSVDTSAPMVLDDTEMWLMLTEMGTAKLSIASPKGDYKLWEYIAPWYASAEEKDLIKLYKP